MMERVTGHEHLASNVAPAALGTGKRTKDAGAAGTVCAPSKSGCQHP